jgi:hypothetical protein
VLCAVEAIAVPAPRRLEVSRRLTIAHNGSVAAIAIDGAAGQAKVKQVMPT